VGFGLDVAEAFRSEVAGLLDAVAAYDYPPALHLISIVEREPDHAARVAAVLQSILPDGVVPAQTAVKSAVEGLRETIAALREVGSESRNKPHVFVAMPFAEEFADRYHYGIVGAANAA